MVVHDLLWLVVSLVSVATFSDASPNVRSVSSAFEYTYLLFWNSFWTLCPVIAIGLFDRIVGAYRAFSVSSIELISFIDDHVLIAIPQLYRYGREGKWFGGKLFTVFMLDGVMQVSRCLLRLLAK